MPRKGGMPPMPLRLSHSDLFTLGGCYDNKKEKKLVNDIMDANYDGEPYSLKASEFNMLLRMLDRDKFYANAAQLAEFLREARNGSRNARDGLRRGREGGG